jgi:S-adenosylmethionine:tRNA ribosyltransferase-isomerase
MAGEAVADHRMHSEHIVVTDDEARRINDARAGGGRVVAVGTTVVRTLESVADADGVVGPYEGPTDLFITPGYRPRIVDAVITNFHAPRTTLLVLIAALMGPRWREVYQQALDRGLRFLSFGDAMFFEVERV